MDPHFQPQSNPYDPQNNLYSSPQAQPGPNKYLTLPPVQNPQYSQQYPAQQPQYYPQGGPVGYLPPANYGNIQPVAIHDANMENVSKIRELERGLETCFMKCYLVWLWLVAIFSLMSFANGAISLLAGSNQGYDTPTWMIGSVVYAFWNGIQSAFGLQAIYQKSLVKANLACWMMSLYLVPCFLAELWILYWIQNYKPDPNDPSDYGAYMMLYFVMFMISIHMLAHVLVNMVGAFRVRKILVERKAIEEKMSGNEDIAARLL